MSKTNLSEEKYEFEFTNKNFDDLRKIVTGHTGIELPDGKKTLMYTRLVRRLRTLKLDDFSKYVEYVNSQMQQNDNSEMMVMVNAMTTNVTSFFREKHHFQDLAESLADLHKEFGKLRIWSCASSTGQEPWSITMIVARFLEKNPGADIKVIATDIDKDVIETAKEGIYELDENDLKNNPYLNKYLEKIPDINNIAIMPNNFLYKVTPDIRNIVTFKVMNLLEDWVLNDDKYHVVFCRNVIIYFSKDTQRALFKNISALMPSKSKLYIGHSENLLNVSDNYTGVGKTSYIRK